MFGDSEVAKVYCGDVVVWEREAPIPQDILEIVDNICTHYNLDKDDCYVIVSYIGIPWENDRNRVHFVPFVAVYPTNITPVCRISTSYYTDNHFPGVSFEFYGGYYWTDDGSISGRFSSGSQNNGGVCYEIDYDSGITIIYYIPAPFSGTYPIDNLSDIFSWGNNQLDFSSLDQAISYERF